MSLKGKSILVTGGAGFIGSHLVDDLVKESPKKIIVVDNMFLGKMSNLENVKGRDDVRVFKEDAGNYEKMSAIISEEKIDVIFDLAVKPLMHSFTDPMDAFNVSTKIAETLAKLLKKGAYNTLIHFSSSEAYGTAKCVPMNEEHPLEPCSTYSAGKAAADLLLLAYEKMFGLDIAIIRPFNNYGPRQNEGAYAAIIPITIKRIVSKQPPIIEWDGKQTRDFLYVKDTTRAAIDIYNEKRTRGMIINVASGKETSIETLVNTLSKELGYKGETLKKPKRPGDVRRHCGDITLARGLIGFRPKVNLDKGIKETVKWYLSSGVI